MDVGLETRWPQALLLAGLTILMYVLWSWPNHYRQCVLSILRGKRNDKPRRDGLTFRVRGVPTEWEHHHLRDALRDRISDPVVVTSLAPEVTGHSSTATIILRGNAPSGLGVDGSVTLRLPAATSRTPSSPGQQSWEQSLTLDVSFFGMTTIYAPPEDDHKVDMIAISGLGGHSFGSFKQRRGEHIWLRDSLPQHMTDEATSRPMARIMTYGYESRLQGSESMQNIEDLATAFHSSILPLVSSPRTRPIIFIAHSLGGLIVKQALITLSRSKSEDDQRLLKAIYGVAFFGVPHDGMDITSLIPIAGDGPNRALVDSLSRVNSLILSMQQRDFHRALGKEGETEIMCFYETLQSPTAQQDKRGQWAMNGPPTVLVTKASATHCRPWEDGPEHICAIARSHSEMVKFGPGDPEYDRVCQRLKGLARRSVKGSSRREVLGTKFMVPFLQNSNFVGRRDILGDVRRRIAIERRQTSPSSCRRVVLHGLGGVGKTQIAIAYAYWVFAQCPEVSVFWVHASSTQRFRESFANIAEECSIPGHDDPKSDVLPLVKRWLERYPKPWLMIIDNADDAQLFGATASILQAIPSCSHGSVLATTRNKQAGMALSMGQQIVEVDALNYPEALELLAAGIPATMSTSEDLSSLACQLECLPLALVQASAFINTQTITTAEYLCLLQSGEHGFAALLDEDFNTAGRDAESSNAAAKTWILSFEQIKRSDALAADLLSLMSRLDHHAIPRDILRVFAQRQNGDKTAVDGLRLTKAIGLLQAFSFVTRGRNETLDMHRLVQLVTRKWLVTRERDAFFAGQALLAVSDLFPAVDLETLRMCRSYLAHARAVRENRGTGSTDELLGRARLLSRISLYLSYQGGWNEAGPLALEAMDIRGGVLPTDHPDVLETMTTLANIYSNQGRWAGAESILLHVYETRARTVGEEHPDTLAAQAILASTYWEQGRWDDSEVMDQRVLAARRRVLGEDSISTLESMGSLAVTYSSKGQWKEADLLRGQVYATAERVLGQQHPFTLEAAIEVGMAHLDKGQWEEAEALLKETLAALRSVRGEEHPTTMVCMGALGQCYRAKGMWKEAEILYEGVLKTWHEAIGREHPDALRCATFLVQNHAAQQRWEEAEVLGHWVVEATERVCGPQHPNTLESIATLADVYIGESRWADAERLGQQVLGTRERILGEEHPDTLRAVAIMSRVLYGTSRWEEAEVFGTRAVNARAAVLGADHPDTLDSLGHLASIYSEQERWEDAQSTLSRLLKTQKEVLGEENPETIKNMAVLALAFSDGGRHEEATGLNTQVIEARKRLHGEDDPETLKAMANQAFVFMRCGEWGEALSLSTLVMDAQERILGGEHPDTLTSMSNTAFALRGMGRAQEALSMMQECAHLRMEILGWEHPDTEVSMEALDAWIAEGQPE